MKTKEQVARHERDCQICNHAQRDGIEQDFCDWQSPSKIARQYRLNVRALYRHCRALELLAKRDRNIRRALTRMIERGINCRMTAAVVIQAIGMFAKINASGLWIDRTEHVNVADLFEKLSRDELDAYARDGSLPAWFVQTVGSASGQAN